MWACQRVQELCTFFKIHMYPYFFITCDKAVIHVVGILITISESFSVLFVHGTPVLVIFKVMMLFNI